LLSDKIHLNFFENDCFSNLLVFLKSNFGGFWFTSSRVHLCQICHKSLFCSLNNCEVVEEESRPS
jgi:hypothetical protein